MTGKSNDFFEVFCKPERVAQDMIAEALASAIKQLKAAEEAHRLGMAGTALRLIGRATETLDRI